MSKSRTAKRIWLWINKDSQRWQIAQTDEGFCFCPVGSGGKRRGSWQSGFPPGLEDFPTWLEQP